MKRLKTKVCRCARCQAGRRVERIAKGLSKEDAIFLRGIFDALMELSAEASMRESAGRN